MTIRVFGIFTLLLFAFCPHDGHAAVTRYVYATYQRTYDVSPPQQFPVLFLTGKEVNDRARSYQFNPTEVIGIVLFPSGGKVFLKTDLVSFQTPLTPQSFCDLFAVDGVTNAVQLRGSTRRAWTLSAQYDDFTWVDRRAARQC